ncbi:hypothetical protein M404DRAFT_714060 [Pisolithus tinctorius Marx 270]|uniref:Uncharacterized protein n=1 Tax=Pisolithus tinctorius Marx 270 TaxID=870435 RepID=A0A0C3P4F1_PISTI|nr:hypothetical protein M404DRAFT_714060 [Pisolithus tinctorius Marx 270]
MLARSTGIPDSSEFHSQPAFMTVSSSQRQPATSSLHPTLPRIISIDDDDDPIMTFDVYGDSTPCLGLAFRSLIKTTFADVALLSGPGGSILRTYGTSTGHLLLEPRLHNPADA